MSTSTPVVVTSIGDRDFFDRVAQAAQLHQPLAIPLTGRTAGMHLGEWAADLGKSPELNERFATACDHLRGVFGEIFIDIVRDFVLVADVAPERLTPVKPRGRAAMTHLTKAERKVLRPRWRQ